MVMSYRACCPVIANSAWVAAIVAATILMAGTPSTAVAQTGRPPANPDPWRVTLAATLNPLPIGACGAIQMTVLDPVARDQPRNPLGTRISLADFDVTVTAPGGGAAAEQIDASHVRACACQSATTGSTGTITVTYPSQTVPAAARVAGVQFQRTATFVIGKPENAVNPPACLAGGGPAAAGAGPSLAPIAAGPALTPAPAPSAVAPPVGTTVIAPTVPPPAVTPLLLPPGAAAPTGPVSPTRGSTPTAIPLGIPSGLTAVQTGPFEVRVSWQPVAGASNYVFESPNSVGPAVMAVTATTANLGVGRWDLKVRAVSGVGGSSVIGEPATVTIDVVAWPVNPKGFAAVQTGPGKVRLSWQQEAGVAYYLLLGPGLPAGGTKVIGATTIEATSVPDGNQEWAIGSYYDPAPGTNTGPVSTAAALFPRVTLNVLRPVVAGTYRVTVTGLRAFQASMDDVLSRDGRGDEVYAAAYVRRYDRRTAQIVEFPVRRTRAYGDVTNFATERIQAGSISGTGGIRDGDPIPPGPLVAERTGPAQDTIFPWKLWEGPLTNDVDALLISPSLWEIDGQDTLYPLWEQQQQALNTSIFPRQSIQNQITQQAFGVLVSSASGIGGGTLVSSQVNGAADMALMHMGVPVASLLSASNDRPIGLMANGADSAMLLDQVVVLTREIIEAALARPALGLIPSPVAAGFTGPAPSGSGLERIGTVASKPGLLVIQFEDRNMPGLLVFPERPAIYQMFLQVERVP